MLLRVVALPPGFSSPGSITGKIVLSALCSGFGVSLLTPIVLVTPAKHIAISPGRRSTGRRISRIDLSDILVHGVGSRMRS